MNYKEARALVVSPLYKGVKRPGGIKHPSDLDLPLPVGNWGARFSVELFYEKVLNSYMKQYFDVAPSCPWLMDIDAPRGRK